MIGWLTIAGILAFWILVGIYSGWSARGVGGRKIR